MGKVFFSILFFAYCAALVLAAIPQKIAESLGIQPVSAVAYTSLEMATIVPGLRLFYRPYDEPLKVRHQCFQVKAFAANGSETSKSEIGTGCSANYLFQWKANGLEVMVFRLFEEAAMERLEVVATHGDTAWSKMEFATPREESLLAALGDHFCRRAELERSHIGRIMVGWHRSWLNYSTRETTGEYFAIASWSCNQTGNLKVEWAPHIASETIDEMAR